MTARPYLPRQASPTPDGTEEMLWFLCDPLTRQRVRAFSSFARVVMGLETPRFVIAG